MKLFSHHNCKASKATKISLSALALSGLLLSGAPAETADQIRSDYSSSKQIPETMSSLKLAMRPPDCESGDPTDCTKKTAEKTTTQTTKTIYLIDKKGTKLPVGTIAFSQKEKGETFKVTWDDKKFGNFFLNMAPFKCIEGALMYCHLPYPYKTHKLITANDLKDLEYELLFVQKVAKEYGIDFWHGVYFRLQREADGGYTGKVFETDMNELVAPPEKEYDRPIGGDDLVEAPDGKHRFPKIEIR